MPDREQLKILAHDLRNAGRMLRRVPDFSRLGHNSPAAMLARNARRQPRRTVLGFEDRTMTWEELDAWVDRWAAWLTDQGVGPGDAVAVLMANGPAYLAAVLGLSRVRAVAALINTSLRGHPLVHAVTVATPVKLLVDPEHHGAMAEVLDRLDGLGAADLWIHQGDWPAAPPAAPRPRTTPPVEVADPGRIVDQEIAAAPADPAARPRPDTADRFAYIYTSGTTGLPKAAVITNQRMLAVGAGAAHMLHECKPGDVIYVALPMFHSSAMFLGVSAALSGGAALALRRRFSVSTFWSDICESGATSFLYIGELCRYLLQAPTDPYERRHRLRVGVGNGLRPDVWEPFLERFDVPLMREFYGSTEGTAATINYEGRPGMIGRLPPGHAVIRCDLSSGEPIRNAKGRCERVEEGETGLLVAKIHPLARFEGYVNPKATQKKILEGVFKPRDQYFNSGDLVTLHDHKWLSFADRVGDTFRWKGENVSTMEVAALLSDAPGVLDINVYGVQVPHADGRAGMAAVTVDDAFDRTQFARQVDERLAPYQRPYFLRLLAPESMRTTETFKHQKVDYRDEGFDPRKIDDPLLVYRDGRYEKLTAKLFDRISAGEVRIG